MASTGQRAGHESRRHKRKQHARRRRILLTIVFSSLLLTVLLILQFRRINRSVALAKSTESGSLFRPTVANKGSHSPAPEGMVWIPGGEFSMGASDTPGLNEVGMKATEDARPIHRVYVDGFLMDKTYVTNEQFARFVKATGYVTIAERTPRAEDFPGAPKENLVAGSVMFSPPAHPLFLNNHFR